MANPTLKNAYLPVTRQHVRAGSRWAHEVGTDYWLQPSSGLDQFAAASTATGDELAENGWIATSLVNTAGGGSDMFGGVITPATGNAPRGFQTPIPSDMGTPQHALTDATGDLLGSPSLFGDYSGAYAAMRLAGKSVLPRYLIGEFVAAFTVANAASEWQSAFGFFNAAATISVRATQYAVITSDGTNFFLAGNSASMQTGVVIDTNWHIWKIVIQFPGYGAAANAAPSCYAFRDGVAFSTVVGAGVQDQFPLRFGFHTLTTNRIGMGQVHVYYDW